MSIKSAIPFYIKASQLLIGLVAFLFIMYIGQEIILPVLFAGIIAILLNPIVNFLCGRNINRILAIIIAILAVAIVLLALIYFFSSQIAAFSDEFPKFKNKIFELYHQSILWISHTFNVDSTKVLNWVEKTKDKGLSSSKSLIGPVVNTIGGLLILLIVMPVYIFLILVYKPLFLEFIKKLFPVEKHKFVSEVIVQSKSLIQSYLFGLMIETGIIAFLNSLSLLILGVESAILIGVAGALLNLIPYIGGVIAIALAMIMAITSQPPIYALWVFILYNLIQFFDNHLIVPKIVASKVNINAFFSIIVVLIGGALWGIPGMFLSIPLTAIVKIIFDRIESLEPIGFLLGNNLPSAEKKLFHKSQLFFTALSLAFATEWLLLIFEDFLVWSARTE
jgi:AI-2 transport protein TqsA